MFVIVISNCYPVAFIIIIINNNNNNNIIMKIRLLFLAHQERRNLRNGPFHAGGHKKDQCTRCIQANVLVPRPPSRAFSQQE